MKYLLLLGAVLASVAFAGEPPLSYTIVGTGQTKCYDNRNEIALPKPGQPFYGQDAQFSGHQPSYEVSADGLTVRDQTTGLTWQCSPDTDEDGVLTRKDKLTWTQAQAWPAKLNATKFGGFGDWRLPSIKELYSLFDARGTDPSGPSGTDTSRLTPFINTKFFKFAYGDTRTGERVIDSQYASSTKYVGKSARGFDKLFGVNFADGRIKGYDLQMPGGMDKTFFVQCVRGNPKYGLNDFHENGDSTITDRATGLMWCKADSGKGMNWQEALAWVQAKNAARYLGHEDWRLPSVKELQSIVDYARSPDTTQSTAIDPVFECTQITNEGGKADYPFYWSGTTHAGLMGGGAAMYVAFGRAGGWLSPRALAGGPPERRGGPGRGGPGTGGPGPDGPGPGGGPPGAGGGEYRFVDVHGAGAQRSDPKAGDPAMFPHGRGPQGDVIRINNFVRLVRTAPGRDASSFILRSPEVVNGGTLPKEFTGDGDSATLPLEWKGAPAGTKSYALIMHHIDPEGRTKWYWILYEIPATVQSLPKNVKGVGTLGNNSINGRMEYAPPHSKGPGPKEYIFTVYALSAPPQLDVQPAQVNREILLAAMKDRILGSAELQVVYTRSGEGDMPGRPGGPPPGGPNRQGREDQRPKQAAQEAPDPDATKEAETAK